MVDRLFTEIRWILRKTHYTEQAKLTRIRDIIDKIDKSLSLSEQEELSEFEEKLKLHLKYK